ncbi:MAG: 16S rRNA (guanine(527)-N(7))-methyltransferase RsmG [Syntrophotaleaceae bacterium]
MSDREKLSEMLAALSISVSEKAITQLLHLRNELLRWNSTINLTAIKNPDEAMEKHLVDSLTLLPFIEKNGNLLDLGSGAGFPGIPIKIVCPDLEVWSIDSNGKKIAFQNHMVRELSLQNFKACRLRAENLQDVKHIPKFGMIVARAFSGILPILELAEPLLSEKGMIVAMKGPDGDRELAEAAPALAAAEMVCSGQHSLQLPVSGASRTLFFFSRKNR